MAGWIDITEYAHKYGVSTSTLRRRIRANSIPFQMQKGKYLLEDSADIIESVPLFSRRISVPTSAPSATPAPSENFPATPRPPRQTFWTPSSSPAPKVKASSHFPSNFSQEQAEEWAEFGDVHDPVQKFLESDNVLPVTLRSEYDRVLAENRTLKAQLAELETLLKALETDHAKHF